LQQREFRRLGNTHIQKVKLRAVAASKRDLEKIIAAGEFRSDPHYRVDVFPIRIPPLRKRADNITSGTLLCRKVFPSVAEIIESVPTKPLARQRAWHGPGNTTCGRGA